MQKRLVGTMEIVSTTSVLTVAFLTCVKATSTAITTWDQARGHRKLRQWHGKLRKLLVLHCKLLLMKTGSLPVVNPELYTREKQSHRLSHLRCHHCMCEAIKHLLFIHATERRKKAKATIVVWVFVQ